jgi:hypothetical protein
MMDRDVCGNIYTAGRTDSITAIGSFVTLLKYVNEDPCYASVIEPAPSGTTPRLYPNPADTHIQISFTPDNAPNQLYVYDSMGKVVLTERITTEGDLADEIILDLSSLTPGIYLVTDGISMREKLVVL